MLASTGSNSQYALSTIKQARLRLNICCESVQKQAAVINSSSLSLDVSKCCDQKCYNPLVTIGYWPAAFQGLAKSTHCFGRMGGRRIKLCVYPFEEHCLRSVQALFYIYAFV